MPTEFVCAYFGGDQHGITWTITARGFCSLREAEKHGLYMMPMAGCFGFAVIVQGDGFWQLREDFSVISDNVSVSMGDYNNFSVTNAKRLEYVK